MKVETPKFFVEYKGAKFTFKYGTNRDLLEIVDAKQNGDVHLLKYFKQRLVTVEGLEIDGKEALAEDVFDLPRDVLGEILDQWTMACINFRTGAKDSQKKRSGRKNKRKAPLAVSN